MIKNLLILFFVMQGGTNIAQNYNSFEELKNGVISKSIPLISVEKFRKIQKTQTPFLLLDAREEAEFNVSHIKKAQHIGYDNFNITEMENIDKETIIIVYCSVGYRSEKVGEKLKKAKFNKVMNLQGGIFDWKNKVFPVYDNEEAATEKIHVYSESWGRWLVKGEKVYE